MDFKRPLHVRARVGSGNGPRQAPLANAAAAWHKRRHAAAPANSCDVVRLAAAGRIAEEIPILQDLAGRGDPEALFTLGDVFWGGVGLAPHLPCGLAVQDGERRRKFGGDARLHQLLADGVAAERNLPEALRRLAAEARMDGRRAQMLHVIAQMELTLG